MRLERDLFSWLFVRNSLRGPAVPALKMPAFSSLDTETSAQFKQLIRAELAPAFKAPGYENGEKRLP